MFEIDCGYQFSGFFIEMSRSAFWEPLRTSIHSKTLVFSVVHATKIWIWRSRQRFCGGVDTVSVGKYYFWSKIVFPKKGKNRQRKKAIECLKRMVSVLFVLSFYWIQYIFRVSNKRSNFEVWIARIILFQFSKWISSREFDTDVIWQGCNMPLLLMGKLLITKWDRSFYRFQM